jgi:hypothetical protein
VAELVVGKAQVAGRRRLVAAGLAERALEQLATEVLDLLLEGAATRARPVAGQQADVLGGDLVGGVAVGGPLE